MKILKNNFSFAKHFFILFLLLPACAGKKSKVTSSLKSIENLRAYSIGIEGVECKICAFKVVKILEQLVGVTNVKIVCDSAFKNCYVNLNIPKKHNLDVNAIRAILPQEFNCNYITGEFKGKFNNKLDRFALSNTDLNFKFVTNQPNYIMVKPNQEITVKAKLFFEKKFEDYWMSLIS